jgi:dihydrofolate reductase
MGTIRVIAATDPNGVIGVDGDMPWHYKADFKRFKKITMGGVLVMGRLTWESLPKPLPGRRTVVITRQIKPQSKHPAGSCEYFQDFVKAMRSAIVPLEGETGDVWIAGGGEVYRMALEDHREGIDEIDLTLVPEVAKENLEKGSIVTTFPPNLLDGFQLVSETTNEEDPRLIHRRYERLT